MRYLTLEEKKIYLEYLEKINHKQVYDEIFLTHHEERQLIKTLLS